MMPYRRRQRHRVGHGPRGPARSLRRTPVLAGVCGTDPFRQMACFLDEVVRLGFSGVQNFPTVGLIDGRFRAGLEETGMGYAREVEMIAKARDRDLLTTPYVFDPAEADAMARAGADILVCHFGLTVGGSIGAVTVDQLEDCPALTDAMAEAALAVNPDMLDPRSRRTDRRACRCRVRARARPPLRRLLRRLVDGAPAGRARACRSGCEIQGDQEAPE